MTGTRVNTVFRVLAAGLFGLLLFATSGFAQDDGECQPDNAAPPSGAAKQPLPDLSGTWQSPDGDVTFDVLQQSQTVLAFFEAGSGDCPFGDTRGKYLEGTFDGKQVKGKMTRCTNVKVMITKCGLTPIYDTEFYTESVTRDKITGCWKTEYYGPADNSGGGGSGDGSGADTAGSGGFAGAKNDCPYVRDSSGDKYRRFVLTRKEPTHCPDMAEIEQIDQVAEQAAGFIGAVGSKVSDPKMQGVLESSQGTLEQIASLLGLFVKVGQRCEEIHDALNDLRRFRDAIDEVNGAACGQASAAAFDHLFTAAGKVGERFVDVEGLGALFQLLAANESFFQDVSGAINPEHRWADQFAGIEGYTPACPG